ncbi:TetR/AcrR family transcriptional regulator [Paenibacillus sp. UNC451MF]|uniref:TetR/AcrR family transcriptional regulator n=1 Tax=Paenibacillus sp. UNC451MF TaxID=1449063 RepID=UPI00048B6208|nr:TetR/AcrR family transcriptional regulator [Paenibacillus sp. UNC451MF]
MKRELKRQQTQQLLLDTTKELILEKGCTKTTFSDIMERSGLSKGAIFHYVKSKDELLAMVLQQGLEETNSRFFEEVVHSNYEITGPLSQIINVLPALENSQDITNQVFMYLLGKSDESATLEIQRFYELMLEMSKKWILAGQEHGVIPLTVDADKTADLFVLLSFGFRMRGFVSSDAKSFEASDFSSMMMKLLQPKN